MGKHYALQIQYFWCTYGIKADNIYVRHCPTEKMIVDYMAKPLQGKLFVTFRNVIMGWAPISTLFDIFSPTEERVENNGCLTVKPKATKLTYAKTLQYKGSPLLNYRTIL